MEVDKVVIITIHQLTFIEIWWFSTFDMYWIDWMSDNWWLSILTICDLLIYAKLTNSIIAIIDYDDLWYVHYCNWRFVGYDENWKVDHSVYRNYRIWRTSKSWSLRLSKLSNMTKSEKLTESNIAIIEKLTYDELTNCEILQLSKLSIMTIYWILEKTKSWRFRLLRKVKSWRIRIGRNCIGLIELGPPNWRIIDNFDYDRNRWNCNYR